MTSQRPRLTPPPNKSTARKIRAAPARACRLPGASAAAPVRARGRGLLVPAVMFAAFWGLALVLWLATGQRFWLLNFGWIGTAVGGGFALFAVLPPARKVWGRRLAQLLVGSYMLVFLGLWSGENMQLEGFFFLAYAGFVAAAVIHYLVAKIVGPLLFGRAWCSWACWTAAILDLLPFARPAVGSRRRWGWGRYAAFALSLALVTVAWALGHRDGGYGKVAIVWLVVGNVAYYGLGVALAVALRDNRAFCKYLCPVPPLMKVTAPFALMKIAGDPARCNDCGACERGCPMNVRVARYVQAGTRVLSSECIQCQLCVNNCARGALRLGFGLDRGRDELAPAAPAAPAAAASLTA